MTNPYSVPPDYSFQSTDIQSIDFPNDFIRRLHDGALDTVLLNTLREFGQLHPLLVQEQAENQYHILAGYPYFTACKMLDIKKIVCQILPRSLAPVTRFSLQIVHDLSSPQSSPILQAHLLRQAQLIVSEEDLLSLLSLMGYNPQRYKLKELIELLHLDTTAVLALHRGSLSQKTGKHLSFLPLEDQRLLVNLISAYRLGGSKQQKLVEMVTELVLRDGKPAREILSRWLPNDEKTSSENMPQRLYGMMQYLHEQCYPEKTAAEKKFKTLVQELQPPEKITIEHSLSFENEELEVRLKFADAATLRRKWEGMKAFVQ